MRTLERSKAGQLTDREKPRNGSAACGEKGENIALATERWARHSLCCGCGCLCGETASHPLLPHPFLLLAFLFWSVDLFSLLSDVSPRFCTVLVRGTDWIASLLLACDCSFPCPTGGLGRALSLLSLSVVFPCIVCTYPVALLFTCSLSEFPLHVSISLLHLSTAQLE